MTSMISCWWRLIEKLSTKIIRYVEKVLNITISDKSIQVILQFIKFGIVGVSNSLVNYFSYVVSLLLFREFSLFISADYVVAQIVAFILSVLWSYYWNNKYVFQHQTQERSLAWLSALIKTFISYSFTGLLLSELLLLLWVNIIGLSEFIAPILNILICMPLNFVLNKLWAFKK